MTGSLLDLSVFVSFEVEFDDLRFMGDRWSDILNCSTGRDDDLLVSHFSNVTLNGTGTGGKKQSEVFLDKQSTLFICLIRESEESVFA